MNLKDVSRKFIDPANIRLAFLIAILIKYNFFLSKSVVVGHFSLIPKIAHAFCLILGAAAIAINFFSDRKLFKGPFKKMLLAFIGFYALTVTLNYPRSLFENLIGLGSYVVYFFVLYSWDPQKTIDQKNREIVVFNRILIVLSFLIAAISIWFMVTGYTWRLALLESIGFIEGRYFGFTGNPNRDAIVAMLSVAVTLFNISVDKSAPGSVRLFYILNLAVQVLVLTFGFSRGGQLALLVYLVFPTFLYVRRKIRSFDARGALANVCAAAVTLFLAPLFLFFLFGVTKAAFQPFIGSVANTASHASAEVGRPEKMDVTNGRRKMWIASFSVARENPVFGIGFQNIEEAFADLYPGQKFTALAAGLHNAFLQALVGSGLTGLAIIFCFTLCVFAFSVRSLMLAVKTENASLVFITSLVGAMLLYSTYENGPYFSHNLPNIIFWVYLGYMVFFKRDLTESNFTEG